MTASERSVTNYCIGLSASIDIQNIGKYLYTKQLTSFAV